MGGMTIGRHWPRSAKGDYAWPCSYCGMMWRRSQLRKDNNGSYVCPDEGNGEDETALDEQNRAMTPEGYGEQNRGYD